MASNTIIQQFTSATGIAARLATRPQQESSLVAARELRTFSLGELHDVRGWPVYTSDATLAGTVDALYVDIHAKRVRYFSVALTDPQRIGVIVGRVLVPVGAAHRVDQRGFVVLRTLTVAELAQAPRLAHRPVTRADEDGTLAAYSLPTSHELARGEMYRGVHFDERGLLGSDDAHS